MHDITRRTVLVGLAGLPLVLDDVKASAGGKPSLKVLTRGDTDYTVDGTSVKLINEFEFVMDNPNVVDNGDGSLSIL